MSPVTALHPAAHPTLWPLTKAWLWGTVMVILTVVSS